MTTVFTPKESSRMPASTTPAVPHASAVVAPKERKGHQDRKPASGSADGKTRKPLNPDDLTDEMVLRVARAIGGKHGSIVDRRV